MHSWYLAGQSGPLVAKNLFQKRKILWEKENTWFSFIGNNCGCLRIPPNKAQHELFMFGKNSISIFCCFNAVLQNIRTLWNFLSFQCRNLHKEMMRGPEKTCYETQAGAFDQHERKVQRFLENKDLYSCTIYWSFSHFLWGGIWGMGKSTQWAGRRSFFHRNYVIMGRCTFLMLWFRPFSPWMGRM